MKRAIVVGARGQDGSLLTEQLVQKGYAVMRVDRAESIFADGNPAPHLDIFDTASVAAAVRRVEPDEIYYLAAFHHSAQAAALLQPADIWEQSFEVHVRGLINVLEAIRTQRPAARLFYAASSLISGQPAESPQSEATPMNPLCVYGVTKTAGVHACRYYRARHGLFASAGILYTHESPGRADGFLSRKVVKAAVQIKRGKQRELVLGDLSAQTDWGYAPDYVDAMQRILAAAAPGDFVIATGILHSVRDWVRIAFDALGLAWQEHVREDRSLITRASQPLVGNAAHLTRVTGWRPATSFEQMVERLVEIEGAHV